MAIRTIKKKVISFTEIPEELRENHWISEYKPDCFVEVHVEGETEPLDEWILGKYPELLQEDSFLIHMDY